MLEGVLDERDEEQRSNLRVAVADVEAVVDLRAVVAAKAHQLDVVAHEVHLAADSHERLVRLVHRIAQQVAQLRDGVLRGVGIDLRQTGDVVERVEEEVWVDLVLQPCQLGLGVLMALFFQLLFQPPYADEVTDADGYSCHDKIEQEEHEGAREETHPCIWRHVEPVVPDCKIAVHEAVVHARDEQNVAKGEPPEPALEKQIGPEDVEIGKIDDQRSPQQLPYHEQRRGCGLPIAGAEEYGQRQQEQH